MSQRDKTSEGGSLWNPSITPAFDFIPVGLLDHQQDVYPPLFLSSNFSSEPQASGSDELPNSSRQSFSSSSKIVPFEELPIRRYAWGLNNGYACPVCGKRFNNKKDFRRHYMVHTGEKPFPCPHCPYRARQMVALRGHLALRHRATKE